MPDDDVDKSREDDVIRRLRASAKKAGSEDYQCGHDVGVEWARNDADVRELRRLDVFRQVCGADWQSYFDSDSEKSPMAYEFYCILHPAEMEANECEEFWLQFAKRYYPGVAHHDTDDWLHGFAEGALSAWLEVKDKP